MPSRLPLLRGSTFGGYTTKSSPVGSTFSEDQLQSERRESRKQFIGLSKLDTEEKSFRYLDFADGGTNAVLNRWGQFLQFSRLVVDCDPDDWNYISVEPRNIFRLEHIIPPHEPEQEEEEDEQGREGASENKRGTLGWEPDNPEWEPSVSYYNDNPAYPRRHDKFNALCMKNQGLGLRFSGNTNISELEHYYRNDRWPDVRYTVEGKVKVVLHHYIRNGEVIQDMYLISESSEETELSLEFEFTTGIRIAPGKMSQPKGEEDAPKHFVQRVPEAEASGSHWKVRSGNYYVTASLFENGKPKSFSLLGGGGQNNMTKCDIDIFSDDPIRHCEIFILKSKASVVFTSVFKLDREKVPNTLPQYFDIYPHLGLFGRRWWRFKTESSSFIFRRNLETILSHAIPLPWVDDETYQPYVLHNHNLINTYQTWSSSLSQILYLLEIDKILQKEGTASEGTKSGYRGRIRKVIFGYFVWLLRHSGRNGLPVADILHWSGKLAPPMKKGGTGELVGEIKRNEERDLLSGSTRKSFQSVVREPVGQGGTLITQRGTMGPKTDSSLFTEPLGSTSGLKKESSTSHTSHTRRIRAAVDPPPLSPLEQELSESEDKFRNCCQFLVLLDTCLTNYPDEEPLITRMVVAFLKLAWETIEMNKHRGSHLWPDRLERLGETPSPYARFQDLRDYENCGYGGQGVYVYIITTQVLVWRAIKSTNNLLKLVPEDRSWSDWKAHQSLDSKAVRDRTLEAFRPLGTDTSQRNFSDRFVSTIKGHVREFSLDECSCDIIVPSFVEDFFLDDENNKMFAWTETLKYYHTFRGPTRAQIPDTWESFIRYQLSVGPYPRRKLRKSLEATAYSVGLFAGGVVTPGSHCPYSTSWAMVTYVLSVDHTELLYPQFRDTMSTSDWVSYIRHADMFMPREESRLHTTGNTQVSIRAGVRQDGGRPGKNGQKGRHFDISAEDRCQVNDPTSYGEWYWFREPLFMKHKPKKFEMNREFIETFLQLENNRSWFWETSGGKDGFLKNLPDMSNYDWGNEGNTWIKPYRNQKPDSFHGSGALLKLQERRDRKKDKKRIIAMRDCRIDHLIALMASLDFQESSYLGEFLSRLHPMDSHQMRFEEQTLLPDNLWITEFNINFIITVDLFLSNMESPLLPNYFPRRREKFLSMNDFVPSRMMAEAAMGFRIIGDLHDRYWTCYVFYDFGSKELRSDAGTLVGQSCYGNSPSQRKCLEGFLVCQALDLVLSEAKAILDIITRSMGGGKRLQALFNLLLTEDDLSGEDCFKTMNKNSTFYPWLLEVYIALKDKCSESRSVANSWIQQGENRTHKPRWSEKDQKSFGEEVANNRAEVKARCAKLDKMAKNLEGRIERIKTLKESLSSERSLRVSELSLQQARTSARTADTMSLFAIVTIIYLPLTFSTSIVAIQDFNWSSPAKALVRIMLAVTFGTLILLMNLAFLRRNLAALKTWAQHSIRRKMDGTSEPGDSGKETIHREKRPAWRFWKVRALSLREAEKRSTLLTGNAIHDVMSGWWYWYFMAVFIIIAVPVQELTFIIRTLRLQKIENAGPLKKLFRVPWAPIWILQLALVYVVMLAGYSLLSLVGLMYRTVVLLWTGKEAAEGHKATPEEGGNSLASELEGGGKGLKPEPDRTRKYGWLVSWLMKPVEIMQLSIVAKALPPKKVKKKESDVEKQGTTMETIDVPPST